VDEYVRYVACMVAIDNWDIYPMSGNNYYIYNDPTSGKFHWIPWDHNSCWSGEAERPLYSNTEWDGPVEYAPLHRNVFSRQRYLQDMAAYLDLLQRNWFNDTNIRAKAESLHTMLDPYVDQDTGDKMYYGVDALYTPAQFDTAWDDETEGRVGIADFTEVRENFINEHLLDYLTFLD